MERALVAWTVAALVLLLLPALPSASAHAESEGPRLRQDVAAVWHLPTVVAPHKQWFGFLHLTPDSNVTAAHYQICRVGDSCFAPPAPATALGNGTFVFDTSTYLANGHPVDYQAGWRLGVQWILDERLANGTTRSVPFPAGPDLTSPACAGDAALACNEAHYLAFDLPPAPKSAATPAALAPLAIAFAVVMAAALRRK